MGRYSDESGFWVFGIGIVTVFYQSIQRNVGSSTFLKTQKILIFVGISHHYFNFFFSLRTLDKQFVIGMAPESKGAGV